MKRSYDLLWPAVGGATVIFSFWLLWKQLHGLSAADLTAGFAAIPTNRYFFSAASTLVAYAALAWYDRIALLHIGRKLSWLFISLTSFTTYAISHSVGMTVLSGAVVRFRAYSTKGLSVGEIATVVAFCSLTFALGAALLGGITLIAQPSVGMRIFDAPVWASRAVGGTLLGLAALYVLGSLLRFAPMRIAGLEIVYPRPAVMLRQLAAATLELLGAAGVVYFALPAAVNPGFVVVLGVFIAAFAAGLLSHSPGGLGVLDVVFLKAMPDAPVADVLAALIVFRALYLVAPLILGLGVVVAFERDRLAHVLSSVRARARRHPRG
jgi:glycosyltransferase 2 family protein